MEYVWVVHGEEYAQQCADSIDSVDWPECHVYVDKNYECLGGKCDQHVVEGYHDQPFMLMNVLCQLAHLTKMRTDDYVCFLDSDVLRAAGHARVPLGSWDIAPTWRDDMGEFSDLMPYNYGVLFARATVQAILAFSWMANNVYHQQPKNLKWYGNQVALRELCGAPVTDEEGIRDHGYFNVKVKSLPCEEWNYTPEEEGEDLSGKKFIHLKGDRKHLWEWYKGRVAA